MTKQYGTSGVKNTTAHCLDLNHKLRMNKATSVVKCIDTTDTYHVVLEAKDSFDVRCHLMSCGESARLFSKVNSDSRTTHAEIPSVYCSVRDKYISQEFVAYVVGSRDVIPLWDATTLKLFIAALAMENPEFKETYQLPAAESARFEDIFSMVDRLIDNHVSDINFQTVDEDIYIFRCTHEGLDYHGDDRVKIESSRLKYEESWLS